MKRLLVRWGVLLTALLCLGMAGYAGQVWWARHLAHQFHGDVASSFKKFHFRSTDVPNVASHAGMVNLMAISWKASPWYGEWQPAFHQWFPRRMYREFLRLQTGRDLGDAPEAWEGWLRVHPDLVWDSRLGHLVDPKLVAITP